MCRSGRKWPEHGLWTGPSHHRWPSIQFCHSQGFFSSTISSLSLSLILYISTYYKINDLDVVMFFSPFWRRVWPCSTLRPLWFTTQTMHHSLTFPLVKWAPFSRPPRRICWGLFRCRSKYISISGIWVHGLCMFGLIYVFVLNIFIGLCVCPGPQFAGGQSNAPSS